MSFSLKDVPVVEAFITQNVDMTRLTQASIREYVGK